MADDNKFADMDFTRDPLPIELEGMKSVSDDIKPALTPDEWRVAWHWSETSFFVAAFNGDKTEHSFGEFRITLNANGAPHRDGPRANVHLPARDAHAVAALALHGQTFGFTAEDVRWLWLLAGNHTVDFSKLPQWAESLRARIAALIPPEVADG